MSWQERAWADLPVAELEQIVADCERRIESADDTTLGGSYDLDAAHDDLTAAKRVLAGRGSK